MEIYDLVLNLLVLTLKAEILWLVFPLAVATVVTVVYFGKYNDEKPGWNSYTGNSLVLIFVAAFLLRHIYAIDELGAINFITYQWKSLSVVFLLFFGMLLLRSNFGHMFPEKIARYLSSPLTVNTVAYVIVLYVFTDLPNTWSLLMALLIILGLLLVIFAAIGFVSKKIFKALEIMRKKEKVENFKQERFEIDEMRRELKDRERKLLRGEVKKLDDQKKEAVKLKKVARKEKLTSGKRINRRK